MLFLLRNRSINLNLVYDFDGMELEMFDYVTTQTPRWRLRHLGTFITEEGYMCLTT